MFAFLDSFGEIIVVVVVIVLLFGGFQFFKLVKLIGQVQKEFKKGFDDGSKDDMIGMMVKQLIGLYGWKWWGSVFCRAFGCYLLMGVT